MTSTHYNPFSTIAPQFVDVMMNEDSLTYGAAVIAGAKAAAEYLATAEYFDSERVGQAMAAAWASDLAARGVRIDRDDIHGFRNGFGAECKLAAMATEYTGPSTAADL